MTLRNKRYRPKHDLRKTIRAIAKKGLIFESEPVEWLQALASPEGGPTKFTALAYSGGELRVSAFMLPVVVDLNGLTATAPIPMLLNHDMDRIAGHADQVLVESGRVTIAGVLSGATAEAEQVRASAKQGFPWRVSIGARPDQIELLAEGQTTTVNQRTVTGPLYIARRATLGEVSFVPIGADAQAVANVHAAAAPDSKPPVFSKENVMEFAQWIESLGLNVQTLNEDQHTRLAAKFASEQTKPAEVHHVVPAAKTGFELQATLLMSERYSAAIDAKANCYADKIEAAELQKIRQAAVAQAAEIKAKALAEQWAVSRTEIELVRATCDLETALIRAARPPAPPVKAPTQDAKGPVIEAAFARSCGLSDPLRHYSQQIVEASDKWRGIGLQEVVLLHARANGYSGRERITSENIREVLRAAFSTHTITTMLSSSANKLLLEGFNSMPQSWREVAGSRTVSDFKQVTAYRMTAGLEYEEVGAGGEIQHGTLGQESYTIQAKTYARMLTLTRQDIINDDLGAFNDLRNRLGIGAAIKMNKVWWTAFLTASNAGTFWTSARTNLVTSSALAEAGLNTAVAAFRDLAGPDGNMMNLEPGILLVPSALEATARKLYVSQEQRDTTASTKFPTANIYFNRFKPIVIPELGNSSYTGYSATTWFLLAAVNGVAGPIRCGEMCFLNGVESPTIESADADFETLGIQFRGYHDFGAAMTEWRASVKATA